MAGLIGVAEIWKMFEWTYGRRSTNHEATKKQIIDWLEEVRRELDNLSDVWLKLCSALEKGQTGTIERRELLSMLGNPEAEQSRGNIRA